MVFKSPEFSALTRYSDSAYTVLQSDIVAEKASSLSHHGRQVEAAMAALRSFDPGVGTDEQRLVLVRKAAKEVWAFFVQRELCGFRDQKDVIRQYGIPGEVLVRLGATER